MLEPAEIAFVSGDKMLATKMCKTGDLIKRMTRINTVYFILPPKMNYLLPDVFVSTCYYRGSRPNSSISLRALAYLEFVSFSAKTKNGSFHLFLMVKIPTLLEKKQKDLTLSFTLILFSALS